MAKETKLVSFDLPIELTTEILSRLPVKSLLKLKSICKTWYTLIQSPNFIEIHHKFNSTLSVILVTTINKIYINDGDFYRPIDFGSQFSDKKVDFRVLGVCSGLACIQFYNPNCIIIGNPSTQEFRKISSYKLPDRMGDSNLYGFSSFSNDYKIVRIIHGSVLKAEVYSMITDKWEIVDVKMAHVATNLHFYRDGNIHEVLNGVFYWRSRYFHTATIISFDIYKGIYNEINITTSVLNAYNDDPWRIIEFKEKLALIIQRDLRIFELWVLNKNKSTWTWKLGIDYIPTVPGPISNWGGEINVVGYAKNGELLVEDHCEDKIKLLKYDLYSRETKSLAHFDFHEDNYYYFYTESLRSVKLRNEVAEGG